MSYRHLSASQSPQNTGILQPQLCQVRPLPATAPISISSISPAISPRSGSGWPRFAVIALVSDGSHGSDLMGWAFLGWATRKRRVLWAEDNQQNVEGIESHYTSSRASRASRDLWTWDKVHQSPMELKKSNRQLVSHPGCIQFLGGQFLATVDLHQEEATDATDFSIILCG